MPHRRPRFAEVDDLPRPAPQPPSFDATALARAEEEVEAPPRPFPCPFCGHTLTEELNRCPTCAARVVHPDAVPVETLVKGARQVYVLQALALLFGVPIIPALILAYARRDRARDTWVDTHFDWQIETCWGVFWLVLVTLLVGPVWQSMLPEGTFKTALEIVAGLASGGWYVNRVVKGWMRLSDGEPVTDA